MGAVSMVSKAHDGFGVAFCTTVACVLSIIAITWGPWSQTDLLISEERNVATYSAPPASLPFALTPSHFTRSPSLPHAMRESLGCCAFRC